MCACIRVLMFILLFNHFELKRQKLDFGTNCCGNSLKYFNFNLLLNYSEEVNLKEQYENLEFDNLSLTKISNGQSENLFHV